MPFWGSQNHGSDDTIPQVEKAMALLENAGDILSILVHLATMVCTYMLDAFTFHGEPIVASYYNF